jgi:hypothetical protein
MNAHVKLPMATKAMIFEDVQGFFVNEGYLNVVKEDETTKVRRTVAIFAPGFWESAYESGAVKPAETAVASASGDLSFPAVGSGTASWKRPTP